MVWPSRSPSIPDAIRGFGPVKDRHLADARAKEAALLEAFRQPGSDADGGGVTGAGDPLQPSRIASKAPSGGRVRVTPSSAATAVPAGSGVSTGV